MFFERIFDPIPGLLYRAYKNREFASDFCNSGSFIMRPISFYQSIEDNNRRDKSENEAKFTTYDYRPVINMLTEEQSSEFGPIYGGIGNIHAVYILCFCGPTVNLEYMCEHFGKFIVTINTPTELLHDIKSYVQSICSNDTPISIEFWKIRYTKGEILSKIPDINSYERGALPYVQKYPGFSLECEYRIVLKFINEFLPNEKSETVNKCISINLNKKLEYCDLTTY